VDEALNNIVGVDVHPLAVTIAKVNYVLALTPDLAGYKKLWSYQPTWLTPLKVLIHPGDRWLISPPVAKG
jgi:hypothetical protein